MKHIPFEIIELDPFTYHALIKAENQGIENFWWVLDTGASKSVLDIQLSEAYQEGEEETVMATALGRDGIETHSGTIPSLRLGGNDFGPLKIALVSFEHINTEYAKFSDKKIAGLLGCDFLNFQKVVIDFENLQITIK